MSRSRTERLLLGDDFAAWCAAHPGAHVELLVGAGRMHSLLVPEDLPLDDEAALLAYARLQFTHYFGPAAGHWPLAGWRRGAERGVCALPQADALSVLLATAAAHRVRLGSLRPSWALAPAEDGEVTVLDDGMLTCLERRDGRLVALLQRHAGDELLQELAGARVLRAADLLGGRVTKGGPDFIVQPSRMRPLTWVWGAAAAAACALVATQAQGQREEARRLAEQAAVLDRLASPASVAKAAAPNPAAIGRARAAAHQLAIDWAGRWTALERALPPGLQLTALDVDDQALRLEGQAMAADTVTQLVDWLALHAGPGEEVVLTRLQRADQATDAVQLRFELVRRMPGERR